MENNITRQQWIREYEKLDRTVPMNVDTYSGGNDAPNGEKVSLSEGRTEVGFVFSAYSSVLMVVWSVVGR